MKTKLIILGTGGTCFDIADAAMDGNDYELIGFLDDNLPPGTMTTYGLPVLGKLSEANKFKGNKFVNGIGSPASFQHKEKIISKTGLRIEDFATIIHPTAYVSKSAKISPGTVILSHSSIGANVTIEEHVIVLQNSVIGHDSSVGKYSSISAGVTISGRVKIGDCCYVGAGSSLKENSIMGNLSLLGIGSVLLMEIPSSEIWVGVPAKKHKS